MKFSEYNKLKMHSQDSFEFVNVRIDYDNRLFIDPTRLQGIDQEWARELDSKIQGFFFEIFEIYKSGNREKAKDLFTFSGESNEIFLGYTNGFPGGNGNTAESLQVAFDFVNRFGLLTSEIIGKVEDFPVFVPKFGPDLLSDLVASIVKKELVEFTKAQARIWDIECNFDLKKPYWNSDTHSWSEMDEKVPTINYDGRNYPIVLIPKEIVVAGKLYNSDKYWSEVVSIWRQKYHSENNTEVHKNKSKNYPYASKKDIRNNEQRDGERLKEYLTRLTLETPKMIAEFRSNVINTQKGSNSNELTDQEFDKLINDSYSANEYACSQVAFHNRSDLLK